MLHFSFDHNESFLLSKHTTRVVSDELYFEFINNVTFLFIYLFPLVGFNSVLVILEKIRLKVILCRLIFDLMNDHYIHKAKFVNI